MIQPIATDGIQLGATDGAQLGATNGVHLGVTDGVFLIYTLMKLTCNQSAVFMQISASFENHCAYMPEAELIAFHLTALLASDLCVFSISCSTCNMVMYQAY
jgi:hypothetical protein